MTEPETKCHCGAVGHRWAGAGGILCPPCAYAAHETCPCSQPEEDQ